MNVRIEEKTDEQREEKYVKILVDERCVLETSDYRMAMNYLMGLTHNPVTVQSDYIRPAY